MGVPGWIFLGVCLWEVVSLSGWVSLLIGCRQMAICNCPGLVVFGWLLLAVWVGISRCLCCLVCLDGCLRFDAWLSVWVNIWAVSGWMFVFGWLTLGVCSLRVKERGRDGERNISDCVCVRERGRHQ